MQAILKITFLVFLLSGSIPVYASELDNILTATQPPEGVVFEIVSAEAGLLGKRLPDINNDIASLRRRFPQLPIAIVTHGTEQFDLTIKNQDKEAGAHTMVKKLVESEDVDVHVCGTHAEWYGVMPEDFPDYVDVSAEGPAQIRDYRALGYKVITVTE